VNGDQSIWASAWWTEGDENALHAGEEGNKIGWFRPAGADLIFTGQRLDAEAPPLEFEVPCCYPTRFQASGLYFPTEGCWEVTAQADDRKLSFIVGWNHNLSQAVVIIIEGFADNAEGSIFSYVDRDVHRELNPNLAKPQIWLYSR